MATLEEARAAKQAVVAHLSAVFAKAALVGTAGLAHGDGGYQVRIGLLREPDEGERAQLPETCQGVSVRYVTDCPVKAL